MSSIDREKLQQKIREAIGLEMAAQKAVKEVASKGFATQSGTHEE